MTPTITNQLRKGFRNGTLGHFTRVGMGSGFCIGGGLDTLGSLFMPYPKPLLILGMVFMLTGAIMLFWPERD